MSVSNELVTLPRDRSQSLTVLRVADSYLGRAILHPLNALTLGALGVLSVMTSSAAPLLLGAPVVEGLVLMAVPHCGWFRRSADQARVQRARRKRDRALRALTARMNEHHRSVVVELERLASSLRARLGESVLVDELPVDRLIEAYARLAVAHDEAQNLIDAISGDPTIAALALSDSRDPVARQRFEVARRRVQCRQDNERRLMAMEEQLHTITDLIKLLQERALFGVDLDETVESVDTFLVELDRNGPVLDSLLLARGANERQG